MGLAEVFKRIAGDDEYDGDSYNIRKGGKLDHHPNVHNFESPASGTGPNPAATSTRRNSAAGVTKNIINAPVPRQTRSKTNFVRNRQLASDRAGKVDRGTQTEQQFMGDHPNVPTVSNSVPAVTGPDPVTLIGSNYTTTPSRNVEAGSSRKKVAHVPAPVRNRTRLVSEIGLDPATLTSTAATSGRNMAAGASAKIKNVPVARRTSKSNLKNHPDPLFLDTDLSNRVLDHIRQLAAKIKDYEVPESGGLQVELMEVVMGEIADTASDPNVKEDEQEEALMNQHNQRPTIAANLPSQPISKTSRRKSTAPRRTLGNAFV